MKRNVTKVPLRRRSAPVPITVVAITRAPNFASVRSIVVQGMPSSMIVPKARSDRRVSIPTLPAQREIADEEIPAGSWASAGAVRTMAATAGRICRMTLLARMRVCLHLDLLSCGIADGRPSKPCGC